jgi:dihydrofolate reductase
MEIVAIAAMSLDGFITKHGEEGVAFTSAADKKFFREAIKEFDCCIFGSKTFLASKAGILGNLTPERLRIVLTRSPEKYAAYQHPDMLEFTSGLPEDIVTDLQKRNKTRCAVLGGGEVYTLFLAKNLLNELWLTVEPRIFGDGKKFVAERMDISLSLKDMLKFSEHTILLKYRIEKKIRNPNIEIRDKSKIRISNV